MKLFQVILGVRLLACSHVVVAEGFLEVVPRSDGVLLQAEEPVVCRLLKHDGKIDRHGVFISIRDSHGNLV